MHLVQNIAIRDAFGHRKVIYLAIGGVVEIIQGDEDSEDAGLCDAVDPIMGPYWCSMKTINGHYGN